MNSVFDMLMNIGAAAYCAPTELTNILRMHPQEWCNALIQCQDDLGLNRTLNGIVERLSEMRQIQMEVDTTLRKHISDYIITVLLVLGSIPLMAFMIADWYDMLMNTIPGKITLAVVLATVLITSVWVSRANAPVEGADQS